MADIAFIPRCQERVKRKMKESFNFGGMLPYIVANATKPKEENKNKLFVLHKPVLDPKHLPRKKIKKKLKEEIANSVMNAAGLGVGSPSQREPGMPSELMPMQRRKNPKGRFMNQETFIISHSTFNSLREAKKKHVRWKKYLEEDEAYYDLREYANKKPEGPIIVEDDFTGACMYVRYGDLK